MAFSDFDVAVVYSFGLELDGFGEVSMVKEVSGLKLEQDVIEHKANATATGAFVHRRLPGRPKLGEFTITRPYTPCKQIEDWIKAAHSGNVSGARKTGAITFKDYAGATFRRYTFTNAWPKSVEITSLKAGGTEVADEKIVIVYETLVLEQ
jgi:phage tail-like protein